MAAVLRPPPERLAATAGVAAALKLLLAVGLLVLDGDAPDVTDSECDSDVDGEGVELAAGLEDALELAACARRGFILSAALRGLLPAFRLDSARGICSFSCCTECCSRNTASSSIAHVHSSAALRLRPKTQHDATWEPSGSVNEYVCATAANTVRVKVGTLRNSA